MGRHARQSLLYFPKDVDYYEDYKIMMLMEKYGAVGQTVYDAAITTVYASGYYLEKTVEEFSLWIRKKICCSQINDAALIAEIILYCGELDLFDKKLLKKGVITSRGIQTRYAEVTSRNKTDTSKYWLLGKRKYKKRNSENNENNSEDSEKIKKSDPSETAVSRTSDSSQEITAAEIPKIDTEMQQSKVNKSKVNESKVVEKKSPDCSENSFGTHGLVHLTQQQHKQLIDDYGSVVTLDYINKVDEYLLKSGKRPYSNHFSTILSWLDKDRIPPLSQRASPDEPSFDLDAILEHAKNTPLIAADG